MEIKAVTFFGCACGDPGDPHFDGAHETARLVARSKRKVVNGGGPGIMLAATEGANEVNGQTIAVYYRPELAGNFEGKTAANYAHRSYERANYIARTKKLLELGDAYIVFNGGTGTISEFAMAWGLARLYFGHHKPLLLYGDFWPSVIENIRKNLLIRPEEVEVITFVNSPGEVITALERFEVVLKANRHDHAECDNAECLLLL